MCKKIIRFVYYINVYEKSSFIIISIQCTDIRVN